MRKFRIFLDFEAEEEFLCNMAKQGHILKKYSVFGFYHFEDGVAENLEYKIDYRIFKKKDEFENYITLFEDAGWKHICGTIRSGGQYFLPAKEKAGKEIFSDSQSAASRYKILYNVCKLNVSCFFCYFLAILISVQFNFANLGFLTPGLWERTGRDFWSGFFFELPFVLLRILPPIIFAVVAICFGYWGGKRKRYTNLS